MPSKFQKWARKVFDKYGERCIFCMKDSGSPHHFFPRGQYPDLAWVVENGVPICQHHHDLIEHGGKKPKKYYRKQVVIKRGIEWYENLRISLPEYKRPPKEFYKENGKIKTI